MVKEQKLRKETVKATCFVNSLKTWTKTQFLMCLMFTKSFTGKAVESSVSVSLKTSGLGKMMQCFFLNCVAGESVAENGEDHG